MADRLGSYRSGFTVLAVLAGLGSVFWIFAHPPAAGRQSAVGPPQAEQSGGGGNDEHADGHGRTPMCIPILPIGVTVGVIGVSVSPDSRLPTAF